MSPCGFLLLLPVTESLQTEVEHPHGLAFLLRDQSDDILVQSFLNNVSMNIGGEAEFILLLRHLTYKIVVITHCVTFGAQRYCFLPNFPKIIVKK